MLLKFLRKKKNMKRIIWALAILIIPAFVIWGAGTSDKKREKGPNYAGEIFNKKVSFEEYANMWRVARDYLVRSFGANVSSEVIDQMAWNRLILLEVSKRENIDVKDSEVVERIASFPIFQRDGIFDKKLYKSMLGDSVRGFEEKLRDDIRISKLREKVTANISITNEETKEIYKKRFEKIKASYISIPFSDSQKDVRYQEPEITKYYEKNKGNFRQSERINVKYIDILFSSFDKEVYIKEEVINRYFEEHISDFKKPDSDEMPTLDETIKKGISEKLAMEKKKSLAEELAYTVLDKALDKKNLDEAASPFALETKETGFFDMQQEIPGIGWSYEFTKKGFELEPEEIPNVLIKADNGFYIIQLKEKKESYLPLFAEVRDSVIESYIKSESIKLSEKKAKKVYLAIKNELSPTEGFENIVREIGLEPKQTDFITRDGYIATLGPAREFVEACVSLKTSQIAGPVKMLESWVIARLDEYEDIDEVKFIEEKKGFREELLSRKKEAAFDKWFEGLKKEANFVSHTSE